MVVTNNELVNLITEMLTLTQKIQLTAIKEIFLINTKKMVIAKSRSIKTRTSGAYMKLKPLENSIRHYKMII